MKQITTITLNIFIFLLITNPLYSNMAPPPARLDTNVDGEWSSSSGDTYIINGSTNNRRFALTLKQKGAADKIITAYVGYEGNSFRFREDAKTEVSCIIKDQNTIIATVGEKNYTWSRNTAVKSRANTTK